MHFGPVRREKADEQISITSSSFVWSTVRRAHLVALAGLSSGGMPLHSLVLPKETGLFQHKGTRKVVGLKDSPKRRSVVPENFTQDPKLFMKILFYTRDASTTALEPIHTSSRLAGSFALQMLSNSSIHM